MRTYWVAAVLCLGCSGAGQLVVSEVPREGEGPPAVTAVVDLGGVLPQRGKSANAQSDGVFSLGEWIAIEGKNLAAPDSRVTIDGHPAKLGGYTETGGVIAQLPRHLGPQYRHRVKVHRGDMEAMSRIEITNFVVLSDIGGETLAVQPLGNGEDIFSGEKTEFEVEGLRGHVLSEDGSRAYAIGADEVEEATEGRQRYELIDVELGAKGGPKERARARVALSGPPTDLALSGDGASLFVLTDADVSVVDLEHMKVVGKALKLPKSGKEETSYRRLMRFGESWAAVEFFSNQLVVFEGRKVQAPVSLADPSVPRIVGVGSCDDGTSLWALTGANSRYVGMSLRRVVEDTVRSEAPEEVESPERGELIRYHVANGTAVESERHLLPEGFAPVALSVQNCKRSYVSGASSEFFANVAMDDWKPLVNALSESRYPGRVYLVEKGAVSESLKGLGIFFSTFDAPQGGPPVSIGIRIAPRFLPPSVGVDWKIEADTWGSESVRKMWWTSWLPPYRSPQFTFQ